MQNTRDRIAAGTRVAINEDWFTFGVDIVEFRDSNDIREDVTALRERLAEDGYLFFRGFFAGCCPFCWFAGCPSNSASSRPDAPT